MLTKNAISIWYDEFLKTFTPFLIKKKHSWFSLLEFETILTSLELKRKDKKKFLLDNAEQERIENILKKAVDKESGKLSQVDAGITEDNPDGRECWF